MNCASLSVQPRAELLVSRFEHRSATSKRVRALQNHAARDEKASDDRKRQKAQKDQPRSRYHTSPFSM
jgi:hypothetical protein